VTRIIPILLATSLVIPLAAQEPRFDVRSRLVTLPATVTDEQGRFVDGLDESSLSCWTTDARKKSRSTRSAQVLPLSPS